MENQSNEITVKIKGDINNFYQVLKEKGFEKTETFTMEDTFFIPKDLKINEMTVREILSKAVLAREVKRDNPERLERLLVFKKKDIDENGIILSQSKIECEVTKLEDAKKFMNSIEYKEIMNIKESDSIYKKDNFAIAVKEIENGDNLIEIETEPDDEELDTIEKLISRIKKYEIPIYTDDYFVKKAEVELKKVLRR